jgi:hypothetical protein
MTFWSSQTIIQIISGLGFFSHELIVARSLGEFKSSNNESKQSDKNLIHSSVFSWSAISL